MTYAFERGFTFELRDCLRKVAASAPAGGAAAPPATKPPSPFTPSGSSGAAPGSPPPKTPKPPGIGKAAGVASGLERLYLTLGPSASAKKALRFGTSRMDSHLLGRQAAKRLAQGKAGFGDLVATGRRSADTARGALNEGAAAIKTASPFSRTLQRLVGDLVREGQ